MAKWGIAKLLRCGLNQTVLLPAGFQFEGEQVRVVTVPGGLRLEPLATDTSEWFKKLDRWAGEPFMRKKRGQPRISRRKMFD